MSLILSQSIDNLISARLVVCEGMGDVHFVKELLKHHNVGNCQVGCPSTNSVKGMGKDKIADYLSAIKTAAILGGITIQGLLVIGDADDSGASCFGALTAALEAAEFPRPTEPYVLQDFEIGKKQIKIGTYIIPRKGENGTLEHLLLESVGDEKKSCVEAFLECNGLPGDLTANEHAKMKMSALAAACCRKNPWTSLAYMFSDKGNPVSVSSDCFKELAEFLKNFAA